MSTNLNNKALKSRKALLIFLKSSSAPLVIYPKNIDADYEELKKKMELANDNNPKLIEMEAVGPLKKFSVMDNHIAGLAIQEEIYQG